MNRPNKIVAWINACQVTFSLVFAEPPCSLTPLLVYTPEEKGSDSHRAWADIFLESLEPIQLTALAHQLLSLSTHFSINTYAHQKSILILNMSIKTSQPTSICLVLEECEKSDSDILYDNAGKVFTDEYHTTISSDSPSKFHPVADDALAIHPFPGEPPKGGQITYENSNSNCGYVNTSNSNNNTTSDNRIRNSGNTSSDLQWKFLVQTNLAHTIRGGEYGKSARGRTILEVAWGVP